MLHADPEDGDRSSATVTIRGDWSNLISTSDYVKIYCRESRVGNAAKASTPASTDENALKGPTRTCTDARGDTVVLDQSGNIITVFGKGADYGSYEPSSKKK